MSMTFVEWKDEYTTGVFDYDAQHQALFAMVNELHRGLEAFRPGLEQELGSTFRRFVDLVGAHVQTEDELMLRSGHPGAAEHRAAHGAYLGRLQALLEEDDFGPAAHPRILGVLSKFKEHFEAEDERSFLALLRRQNLPS